ncbi:hypothetical protein GOBAR_DD23019 [Gossypium barbadense]|nr:hypothetical protein GOBAR_DD23019 [Gossypium barbadense]
MRKKANSFNINVPAWAATAPRRIEFWTEVAGRGRRTVARGVTGGWWNRDEVEREGESRLGACMEEVFWRLREGGWKEEEVREMMMMIDGSDHNENKEMSGTQLVMDGEDAAWHVRVLSVVLLRAGWSREDVVYALDLHDVIDDNDDDETLVKDLLRNAPLLVPVYRNCYIPSTPNLSGNPVFYVDTEEIRILSFDITRFFQELELSTRGGVSKPFMRKKANSFNINVPAWAATAPRRIEFWTEVAGRGRRTVARGVTGGWWNRDEVEREGESRLGACMEEVFWRLREGGWKEEEVREMMMMIDGSDHNENKEMSGTQLVMDGEDAAWHVRVLSVVLLRAGWSREDVVYALDLHDVIDDNDDDESMN